MKELLEEYVVETINLKQEIDLLRRLVSVADFGEDKIMIEDLALVAVVAIQVHEGEVLIG